MSLALLRYATDNPDLIGFHFGIIVYDGVQVCDLTDDAGHGFLLATDSIFQYCQSNGVGDNMSAYTRILYRFKDVSLQEYIGIVQSQQ